jgi:ATP-dependent RNA helicase RhlE
MKNIPDQDANPIDSASTAPSFVELGLQVEILKALAEENYTLPTLIQAQAIPALLQGKDLLGIAQTGSGKTAAFALPILQILSQKRAALNSSRGQRSKPLRALVLSPTRELALQIHESFENYGRYLNLKSAVIFGGVGQTPQVESLRRGVDILIATPGRLLDLMGQGHLHLDTIECFVLDEADRMLDMGFIHDIRRILPKLPPKRQSLFFSATLPPKIEELAQ